MPNHFVYTTSIHGSGSAYFNVAVHVTATLVSQKGVNSTIQLLLVIGGGIVLNCVI